MVIAKIIKYNSAAYRKIRDRIRFLDQFLFVRPTLFFPVWIMVLAGVSVAAATSAPELYWVRSFNWWTVLLFAAVSLVAGAAFVQHEMVNRPANEATPPVFVSETMGIDSSKAISLEKILLAVGLGLATLESIHASLGNSGWGASFIVIGSLFVYIVWGYLYSGKRFQWLRKPLLGILAHALAGLFLFLVGWSYGHSDILLGAVRSIPYVLAFLAVAVLTPIHGIKGEWEVDGHTLAARLGVRPTVALGTVVLVLAVIMGYVQNDPVISTAAVISLPLFLWALVFTKVEHVLRAIRYAVFFLAMFLCVRFPWFFVALFVTFYFAKFYYYFRFNVDYPTFHVGHE